MKRNEGEEELEECREKTVQDVHVGRCDQELYDDGGELSRAVWR